MKRIVHLMVADLRRMRWWVAIWLAALVGPVAWAWFVAVAGDNGRLEQLGRNTPLFVAGQLLLGYVLVLVLMQADPAIGTRQFWLTRPIAPWRLLAAKLAAALAILWGGAVLVGVPWWLWNGAELVQLPRLAAEYLLAALFVIVPAMLISALTDTLGRAVLWSFAQGAVILGLLLPLAVMWNPTRLGADTVLMRLTWTLAIWWAMGLAVTGGLFALRRRSWTGWVALGVVAVPFGLNLFAPDGGKDSGPLQPQNPELGENVRVAFRQAWSSPLRSTNNAAGVVPQDQMRMAFAVDPAPASDRWFVGLAAEQQWNWPGLTLRRGHSLTVFGARVMPGYGAPADDPETVAHLREERERLRERFAARGRTLPEYPPPSDAGVSVQSFGLEPSSLPARMAREESRYEGRLWFALLRPTVVNEVPLRVGATQARGGMRVRVRALETIAAQRTVLYVHSEPVYFTRTVAEEIDRQRQRSGFGRPVPMVLHAARKEQRAISSGRERSVTVHGVEISARSAAITSGRVWRNGAWTEPDGWRDGAVLAQVRGETESIFARGVTVERFTLQRDGR